MNAEQKAAEYADTWYPNPSNRDFQTHDTKNLHSMAEEHWINGYNADRWIAAPKDVTEFPMDTLCIFLIPVYNNKLNIAYWDVIAGSIDPENYTEIMMADNYDCGWTTESVMYYSIIGKLPPPTP